MISRTDRYLALAESVGRGMMPPGFDRDNAVYEFGINRRYESDVETVTFKDGKAVEAPYTGLGVTDAVLKHVQEHEGASTFYGAKT